MREAYLRRARSGAIATIAARIVETATGFVVTAAIVRHLTPEQYGAYQIILSTAATASFFVFLGGPSIAGRYVPEFIQRRQSRNLAILTALLIVTRLLGLAVFVAALYAVGDWIGDFFNFTDFLRRWILVVLIYAGVTQLGYMIGPILLASYFEQTRLAIVQVAGSIVRLVIIILVIEMGWGLGGILGGLLALEIALAVIYALVLLGVVRSVAGGPESDHSDFPSRRIVRFALPTLPLPMFGLFRSNFSDNFVISHWLGVQSVGVYGFAFTLLRLGTSLNPVFLLNMQIEHILVRTSVVNDRVAVLVRGHRILATVSFAVVLPLVIVVVLLGDELASSFGFAGTEITSLLIISAAFFLVNGLRLAYGNIFTVMEAMHYRTYSEVFAVYNVVAAAVLVQVWGVEGVAFATGSAALLTLVYEHYVSTQRIGVPLGMHLFQLGRAVINVTIAGVVLAVLRDELPGGIPGLFVGGGIFFVVYGAASLALRPVHPEDWLLLRSLALRRQPWDVATGDDDESDTGHAVKASDE